MTRLTSLQTEFIESVLSLSPRVAAFDCDGTLWSGDAGEGFFSWELDQGLVSEEIVRWARSRYADYKAGQVAEEVMCGEMVTMHRGLREEIVQQACDAYFAQGIAANIFPEMRQLVERLHQSGCDVLGRFLYEPVDHPLRHALLRHPAKSHPGRGSGGRERHGRWRCRENDRRPDNRPSHSSSQRSRQTGSDSIGAQIVARLRLWQRDLGPRDARHVQTPIRHQPQSRSERDRDRERMAGLSAGHEQRRPLAAGGSWKGTTSVVPLATKKMRASAPEGHMVRGMSPIVAPT